MLTGTVLINELVDELNELKLSTMAATLDDRKRTIASTLSAKSRFRGFS